MALQGRNSGSFPLQAPLCISFCTLPERFCHLTLFQAAPLTCSGPSQLSCPQRRCRHTNLRLWPCLQGYKTIRCAFCPVAHHREPLSPTHWFWWSTLLITDIIFFPKPLAIKSIEMPKVTSIFLVVTVLPSYPIISTKSPTLDSFSVSL